MHIFSITLFVIGSYLISNSIIKTNFFEHVFYFNPHIEELKEYAGQDSYLDKALEEYFAEAEENEEDEDDY